MTKNKGGRPPRLSCKTCDRKVSNRSELSSRGRCATCSEARMKAYNRAMARHDPEVMEPWRRAMAAAVGAIIPERSTDKRR